VTASTLTLTATATGTRFDVRVMPRASRTCVDGVRDGRLLVRVTAPPVDRAANEAAVLVLARALDVPPAAVRISAGQTQRNKTVEIAVPLDVLRPRIAALVSSVP
jgi:uncharacterized protein YggU (UPF0235/DUF167 family)